MVCGVEKSSATKESTMSYKYQELISAQGKNFEILKAFLQSLADAGGDEETLNGYVDDHAQQQDIARQIVGGPWKLVNSPKVVDVDWESSFEDFLSTATSVSSENLTRQEMDRPRVNIFETQYPHYLPRGSHTALSYELLPLPLGMNYISLVDWVKNHTSVLAVDRELIAYANRYVSCPCEIISLGSKTRSDCFPKFTFNRGARKGSCSWWGIDSKDNNKAAFYGTIFVLVRSAN
jgi:hypothetical protein